MLQKREVLGRRRLRGGFISQSFVVCLALLLQAAPAFGQSGADQGGTVVTGYEEEYIDMILERRTFLQHQRDAMDINNDGVVDVADLLQYLKVTQRLPQARFEYSQSAIAENSGSAAVRVVFSSAFKGQLNFLTGGMADEGADYTTTTRIIAVDGTLATISVGILNDAEVEETEDIVLTLLPGTGYEMGSPDTHNLTIVDDDSVTTPPTAFFRNPDLTVREDAGTANLTVYFTGSFTGTLNYTVSTSSTATAGADYVAVPGSITVNGDRVRIPVTIINDAALEPPETVILTLAGGSGYIVGPQNVQTLTIVDEAPAAVLLGTHHGTLARDEGAIVPGVGDYLGSVRFMMEIWYDQGTRRLAGQITSTDGSNAVYFPPGTFPLTFDFSDPTLDLSAFLIYTTPANTNSFGKDLSSVMQFSGRFEATDNRWMSGTYAETISNCLEERDVVLSGRFRMFFNR